MTRRMRFEVFVELDDDESMPPMPDIRVGSCGGRRLWIGEPEIIEAESESGLAGSEQ